MNKKWLFVLTTPLITCCLPLSNNWKNLDLGAFKISIPKEWSYQKMQGEDSFVGQIKTLKSLLEFDCSNMGYANHLIPTEGEYLQSKEWLMNYTPFYRVGVTYTANFNVKNERIRQMKEKGITDSTLVKVEADPSYETKTSIHKPTTEQIKKYPKADYIADLTYHDSTIFIPIELPSKIKMSNIKIDTTANYIIKTIWPKTETKGITGIYIQDRRSNLNFNMVGSGLSQQEQYLALRMFKTITLTK